MQIIVVVENRKHWTHDIPGVEVVVARNYLTDPKFAAMRKAGVYNLCRTYGFQGLGYYVSLLAAARGHRPLPSVRTIQALRQSPIVRILSDELDDAMQRTLHPLKTKRFDVSIYFGRNMAKKYDRLSRAIFNQFPAPFLRATFERDDDWFLKSVRLIAASDIPDTHRDFVLGSAGEFFAKRPSLRKRKEYRYQMAILWSEDAVDPPSHEGAIKKFIRAARNMDIDAEIVAADDYAGLAQFDALFIRETTSVEHRTFRFAERAATEGLVVVDDPESIIRCTNKVYQAEVFVRHGIAHPKTLVVHTGNVDSVVASVGLPCVLKAPDSSFSQGVVLVESEDALKLKIVELFKSSDLIVAQEFLPTGFDWRIGVLAGKPFYACKYHMVRGHWQIVRGGPADKSRRMGKVEAVDLASVPEEAVNLAVKSAGLMGTGLYGVDVKEVGGRFLVTEVNDNPSIEVGDEDGVLGDELYHHVMAWFKEQLDRRGRSYV